MQLIIPAWDTCFWHLSPRTGEISRPRRRVHMYVVRPSHGIVFINGTLYTYQLTGWLFLTARIYRIITAIDTLFYGTIQWYTKSCHIHLVCSTCPSISEAWIYSRAHEKPLWLFYKHHRRWRLSSWQPLTQLSLDKMAAILADGKFKSIFLNENDRIPIRISLKFVSSSPIDNKPALVQVMAWRRTGDKPLPDQWWPS